MTRTLPILENGLIDLTDIRIASPCDADWDQMKGDDKVRFCEECKLNVHDFTAMTHEEVSEILTLGEERVCGALFMRADGTFLIEDCPVGFARKALLVTKRSGLKVAALALALVSIFGVALFSGGRKVDNDLELTLNKTNTWEVKIKEKQAKVDDKIEEIEMELDLPKIYGW